MPVMPVMPKKYHVKLEAEERARLQKILSKGKASAHAQRHVNDPWPAVPLLGGPGRVSTGLRRQQGIDFVRKRQAEKETIHQTP